MPNSTAETSSKTELSQDLNAHSDPHPIHEEQPTEAKRESADVNLSRDSHSGKTFKMNEVFKYSISIVILCFGISVITFVMVNKKAIKTVTPESTPQKISVENAKPFYGDITREISGTVVPFREIKIAAQVGGVVTTKSPRLEAGTKINEGEHLIQIDPQLYEIQLNTAIQEMQQAKDQVAEIENEIVGAENLRKNTMREISLVTDEYERIENVGTKSEKTQAERSRLVAENSLTNLENNLANLRARKARMVTSEKVAEQKLKKAELDKVRTEIIAPIEGVVVREMVQQGDYVRAGDPLLILEDTQMAEIITNLTPTDLVWLKTNSPNPVSNSDIKAADNSFGIPQTSVRITDPDLFQLSESTEPTDISHWQGQLVSINGSGQDETTRTTPCRILVKDPIYSLDSKNPNSPKFPLVRGMYVKLKMVIPVSASEDEVGYFQVPARALSDTGEFLWAVEGTDTGTDQQKLHKIKVEVVDRSGGGDYAVIKKTAKLKENFNIIVGPFDEARATGRAGLAKEENANLVIFKYELQPATN
ncbi:HlyD family efflux transporter periplasmic adaptor subunit [Mariniblastus sp.]|nr:HlyD family efflux transporter periplasmic adaptor subunit [Mariniblastus sp.]